MRCALYGAFALAGLLAMSAPAQDTVPQPATDIADDIRAEAAQPSVEAQVEQSQLDPTLNEGVAEQQADASVQSRQTESGLPAETQAGVDADIEVQGLDARASAGVAAGAQAAPPSDRNARWRFVRHNGEWWYWTPENHWMYHRDSQWSRYNPDTYVRVTPQNRRYATGYRGPVEGRYYYDSYGRRYYDDGRTDSYDPYGRRAYREGVYYDDGFYGGNQQFYDGRAYDRRFNNPGFRRGANLGGAVGEAIGGDVGGAIGAEIGGAIGD